MSNHTPDRDERARATLTRGIFVTGLAKQNLSARANERVPVWFPVPIRDLRLEFGDQDEGFPTTGIHRLVHTRMVSADDGKSSGQPKPTKNVDIRKSKLQPDTP